MHMYCTRKDYSSHLDYYTQSSRLKRAKLKGFDQPSKFELTLVGASVANAMFLHLQQELPSWITDCFNLIPTALDEFPSLGRTPFTTMSITKNYWVNDHGNKKDTGFGFISWFEKDIASRKLMARSVFRLC